MITTNFSARFIIAWILVVVGSASCSEPDFRLSDGKPMNFTDYKNKWLIVNYWAEWCAPCRKEIPELNALAAEGTAAVLGVNFDGLTGEALQLVSAEMNINFDVMEGDPAARWDQPRPKVLPTSFIIDPSGKLNQVLIGPQTQEDFSRAVQAIVDAGGLVDDTELEETDGVPLPVTGPTATQNATDSDRH